MTQCRACGADRAALDDQIEQLKAEADYWREACQPTTPLPPAAMKLTPSEGRALIVLMQRNRASNEVLARAVCKDFDACVDPVNVLKTIMCRLRAKIRPLGIEILTIFQQGYELAPASRETVAKLFDATPQKSMVYSSNQPAGRPDPALDLTQSG